MIIHIKNLRLRTIIGIYDWERENKQDVVINIKLQFDGRKAAETDDIHETIDYKHITKQIINEVENSQYYLVEKLAESILEIIMTNKKVQKASVEVDKPHALRFADSVSITCSAERTP